MRTIAFEEPFRAQVMKAYRKLREYNYGFEIDQVGGVEKSSALNRQAGEILESAEHAIKRLPIRELRLEQEGRDLSRSESRISYMMHRSSGIGRSDTMPNKALQFSKLGSTIKRPQLFGGGSRFEVENPLHTAGRVLHDEGDFGMTKQRHEVHDIGAQFRGSKERTPAFDQSFIQGSHLRQQPAIRQFMPELEDERTFRGTNQPRQGDSVLSKSKHRFQKPESKASRLLRANFY